MAARPAGRTIRARARAAALHERDWLGRIGEGRTVRGDVAVAAGSLAGAGAVLLATWLGAHGHGFGGLYTRTRAVYVGAAGVAWSAFWYAWSVRHLPHWLGQARDAFELAGREREWERFEECWRRRLRRAPDWQTVAIVGLIWAYVLVGVPGIPRLWGLPNFPGGWSRGSHLVAKEVVLGVWSVPIALVLVPNVVGSLKYWQLVSQLVGGRRLTLVASVPAVREALRPVAWFGVVTSAAWTGAAVAILAALGPRSFDWGALAVVVVLGLLGVQLLLSSQVLIHRALERLRRRSVGGLLSAIRLARDDDTLRGYEASLRAAAGDATWVHASGGVGAAVGLLIQAALPAATFLLKILVVGGSGGS